MHKEEIKKYLAKSTLEERQALADRVQDKETFGKLLFIEDTIMNQKLLALQKSVSSRLDKEDRAGQGELITLYKDLEETRKHISGINLSRGYGVPLQSDNIFEQVQITPEQEAAFREKQGLFIEKLKATFQSEQDSIQQILEHKQNLLMKIN